MKSLIPLVFVLCMVHCANARQDTCMNPPFSGYPHLPQLYNSNPQGSTGDWTSVDNQGNTNTWNLCGAQSQYPLCHATDVSVFQNGDAKGPGTNPRSCGNYASQTLTLDPELDAIIFTYIGSFGSCGFDRVTNITVYCDHAPRAVTAIKGIPQVVGTSGASIALI